MEIATKSGNRLFGARSQKESERNN